MLAKGCVISHSQENISIMTSFSSQLQFASAILAKAEKHLTANFQEKTRQKGTDQSFLCT